MRLAFFVALVVVVAFGWHAYLWIRVVRPLVPAGRLRGAAAAFLVLFGLLTPLAAVRPRFLDPTLKRVICAVAFPWIGVAILVVCALLATEGVRAVLWAARIVRKGAPPDAGRRKALSQVLGGAAVAAGGATALAGAAEALDLVIERHTIPLGRLPAALSGTRIVQISDLHVGISVGREYLERVIAAANALDPDLVAITGDLVDGSVAGLGAQIALLQGLRTRYGVFFVTGNHEYYSGADAWADELRRLGITVLRNERVSIGTAEASFDLAGVDDANAGHHRGEGPRGQRAEMGTALAGRDPERELVLLAHQPVAAFEAHRHGVGLQLSGHTHGGQIFPLRLVVWLDQPFIDGLHRMGDTFVYVSRGTGYWGPPMRVGARPEIAEITLVRA